MLTLAQNWKIARDPQNQGRELHWYNAAHPKALPAPVPGIIQQVFPDQFGLAWYWTTFHAPRVLANQRLLLKFAAVDYMAEVWLNGTPRGSHEGGETPFIFDITDTFKSNQENLLAVRVLNPTDLLEPGQSPIDGIRLEDIPHRNKTVREYMPGRFYNYGGIIAPVTLEVVPDIRVADVYTNPDPATGKIHATITLRNDTPKPVTTNLELTAGPVHSGQVQAKEVIPVTCPPGKSTHAMTVRIPQVHLWNLDDPFLYFAIGQLQHPGGGCMHEHRVHCGFRELRIERGYFRLNGKRIFLKSTHTGNHFPIGQIVPTDPDLMRRDLLLAKTAGYNMVRFISGIAYPEQLDYCDQIGLMVYQESLAGWLLGESPEMKHRFDLSVREMILRDRNHPCITIWGMLNETFDGPVFRHTVDALKLVRELDKTRLVLLNSGRFDNRPDIGSFSNPWSNEWEYQWGAESPGAVPSKNAPLYGGCYELVGDVHAYPPVPHTQSTYDFLRTLGRDTKPVFLSEYGIGSLLNVVRLVRQFEQHQADEKLSDFTLCRSITEKLEHDWQRWGFENTYPFLEDMLLDSERLHSRQRLLGFDIVRSNPKICGFNLTGMLDHAITGEGGAWTFFREWKVGTPEAFADGFAPVRWCLFATPTHVYSGRPLMLEAVLANEDVLPPGEYPVTLRIHGKNGNVGTVWEKKCTVKIPQPPQEEDGPLAIPVFKEEIVLNVPEGEYIFAASMDRGGAPCGGRLTFRIAEPIREIKTERPVLLWGLGDHVAQWLKNCGVRVKNFDASAAKSPEKQIVLVGDDPAVNADKKGWEILLSRIQRGDRAIFLSPKAFTDLSRKPAQGILEKRGSLNADGWQNVSVRHFEVPNAPREEWELYSHEFWGSIHYRIRELPAGTYRIVMGFCEGHCTGPDQRTFDMKINGRKVLEKFDIVKEAGGPHRAVTRTFNVSAEKGVLDVLFSWERNAPSLSWIRFYDSQDRLIFEDSALQSSIEKRYWLPLKNKGEFYSNYDWLYHKECVAKKHPAFAEMRTGLMDWDYYGPVISRMLLRDADESPNVMAAGFATGYCTHGGYVSGLMLAEYPLGAGRFVVNTFQIVEHLTTHPAADKLARNLLNSEF